MGFLKYPNDPYMPAKNKDGSVALDYDTDYISIWKVIRLSEAKSFWV